MESKSKMIALIALVSICGADLWTENTTSRTQPKQTVAGISGRISELAAYDWPREIVFQMRSLRFALCWIVTASGL